MTTIPGHISCEIEEARHLLKILSDYSQGHAARAKSIEAECDDFVIAHAIRMINKSTSHLTPQYNHARIFLPLLHKRQLQLWMAKDD